MDKLEESLKETKKETDELIRAFEGIGISACEAEEGMRNFMHALNTWENAFDVALSHQSNNWRKMHGIPMRRKIRI